MTTGAITGSAVFTSVKIPSTLTDDQSIPEAEAPVRIVVAILLKHIPPFNNVIF